MIVQGKRALVVGLARSGLSVALALQRHGAAVTVLDRKPPVEFGGVLPQLLKEKIGVELGSQRVETFLRHDFVVISPGVPWDLPQLQAARGRNIPVYPEVEAATWFLDGTVVGVTGSNGKTTTTSLLGEMLKASGFPTFVGGNIGNALSSAVDHAQPGTRFVTELSSFQLEGIHDFRPHVAVILNLSPNHLDRHPSLEAYAQAKKQIFRNQTEADYAVLNADDAWVAGLQAEVHSRPVLFSCHRELPNGVFASGGKVYYRTRHLERVLFETYDVALRGSFNLEDVLAATTAACLLGADFSAIRKAVRDFKAVEHRLEFVREIQGVDFFNNSKATSVDATLKSLEAFGHGVHLIMGGKDKGAPYTPLLPLIKDRVREILVIGAAAPVITQQLAGSTELVQAGDLATAVYEAFARSRPGDTVLLAPACSSFDQFKDYEERGRIFKELVKQLAEYVAARRVARPKPPRVAFQLPPVAPPAAERAPEAVPVTSVEQGKSPVVAVESPRPPSFTHAEKREVLQEPENAPEQVVAPTEQGQETIESPLPKAETHDRALLQSIDEEPPPRVQFAEGSTATPEVPPASVEAPPSDFDLVIPSVAEPDTDRSLALDVVELRPEAKRALPGGSHHLELTYVYEVDAMEMPGTEFPGEPEYEPEVTISASTVEALDDDVLPFEVRPASGRKSGARSSKSKGPGMRSNGPPPGRQPKLFEGSEN